MPNAVVKELEAGLAQGVNLPDLRQLPWITVIEPTAPARWRMVSGSGAGESSALALAAENPDAVLLLDDLLARRMARLMKKLAGENK